LNIAFYISGHGYGHASRSIELIHALLARQPDLRILVKTKAPEWLFDTARLPGVEYESFETDIGMTQTDSLTMDVVDTARRAAAFHRGFDRRVEREASVLRSRNVALVLSDIPPLAHAAAARAAVPSIAIGNFTWDWIYERYATTFEREAPAVIPQIRDAYRLATRALRLPMHGGFATIAAVVDIPLIARRSTRGRKDTRQLMRIPGDRPFVLASFGGYGVDIPFEEIARREGLTVLSPATMPTPPLSYQDLVAAADAVLTKPGYGIVSECAANGTPLLYTSRGPFAEYDVFVAEMPRILRCRFMPQDDLRSGRWRPHIDALLAQSAPPERARIDGAEVAANMILS
jgi:UDP:flavonoid glycosyltransferase YjiC (YdhE family)